MFEEERYDMTDKTIKKIRICNLLVAIIGIGLAVLVKTIASPCGSMIEGNNGAQFHMYCYYTGVTAFFIGILACVTGIEHAVNKVKGVAQYISMAILLFIIPNKSLGFGVCQAEGMACSTTKMCIWIAAGLILVLAIVQLLIKGEKDI